MSPENRDLSAWEYTGKLLTERQATIFDRMLQGETMPKIAEGLGISLLSVKSARKRINAKIENQTGVKPKDFYDTISVLIQLGELTYNPPPREI